MAEALTRPPRHLRLRLRRDLRRRPGPQGQPGLRVRRPVAARGLRRRRRRGPRRRRLEHRDPAAAPAGRPTEPPERRPAEPGSPARCTAPHDRIGELGRRGPRRSTAPAPPPPSRSSTARGSASATSATAAPTCSATARSRQLTNDHTFVQSLIDEGRITEEEARVHPHRNLILKAIDGVHEPEPDLFVRRAPARRPAAALQRRRQRRARRRPLADILGDGHRRLRRRRAGPRQPRGRQLRQRHRASSPTSSRPPSTTRGDRSGRRSADPGRRRRRAQRARPGGMPRAVPRPPRRRHRRARARAAEIPDGAVRDHDRPDRPRGGCATRRGRRAASRGSRRLLALAVIVVLVWLGRARPRRTPGPRSSTTSATTTAPS